MKDPVCGMKVDPAKAAGTSEYQGQTYHFCSSSCQAKFDATPGRFVSPPESPAPVIAGTGEYTCPMHPEIVRDARARAPSAAWRWNHGRPRSTRRAPNSTT
nr:YHS domain-containing protein [Luteitalea sp.]